MQSSILQNKKLIIEVAVAIAFLVGIFYFYKVFSVESTLSTTTANEQLLGSNMSVFLKIVTQGNVSFQNTFLRSDLFLESEDFTEEISRTETRGRADPFVPYAASRPLR